MATTMKLIAKNVLGSSASSITFSNIPGTYTDLMIVSSARSDRAGQYEDGVVFTFNSDTGNNYSSRRLYAVGDTAYSGDSQSSAANLYVSSVPGATVTANTFSNFEVYIPNYAGSTNKSVSGFAVSENNNTTANMIGVHVGLWANTAAITSMQIKPRFATNFISGSSFFLYGITKA